MAGIVRKLRPGILHAAIFLKDIKKKKRAECIVELYKHFEFLRTHEITRNLIARALADHDTITTGHATAQSSKNSNCFSFSSRRKQVQEVNSKSSIRF